MRALTQPARISPLVRRMSHAAMAQRFPVYPPARYRDSNEPVKRPKEFASFSYDEHRRFHLGDKSLKWYYPPNLGADLSDGFERFDRHDYSIDEHLDGLLRTIADHEQKTGEAIDAQIVTWRGMLTKIMAAPYENQPFEMNATFYRDCIFIEENHEFSYKKKQIEEKQIPKFSPHGRAPQEVMQYWGYKFEALSTIPRPWGETSRDEIESRELQVVNNKEQYCSVVRTGFGKTIVCLGGEVDALWDAKPETPGDPINWVELKTSAEIISYNDQFKFDRKAMRYWIQSFLLGVPKIIVGFRSKDGILQKIEEFDTMKLPYQVQGRGRAKWDGNVCIKFTSLFLEWLRLHITEEGVWRIKRAQGSDHIEIFRVEEVGHGDIVSDDFMNWRIKLEFQKSKRAEEGQSSAQTPEPEPRPAEGP